MTVYPVATDMQVATMTLICKIGACIDMKKVIAHTIERPGEVEKIIFGNSKRDHLKAAAVVVVGGVEEVAAAAAATAAVGTAKKEDKKGGPARKNKKKKKHFYNQVTLIIKPFAERLNGINMKMSENGSLQLTGPKNVEEGHMAIRRMVSLLYAFEPSIFYKKTRTVTAVSDEDADLRSTVTVDTDMMDTEEEAQYNIEFFTPGQIAGLPIISTKCELIIASFQIPFLVQLSKFNGILTDKYHLLSIFGTSSYPGINTKMTYTLNCTEDTHVKKKKRFLCQCRDMSIFTFRTGKIIITGFENMDKLHYIFEKYISIVKAEESNIKFDSSGGGGGGGGAPLSKFPLKKHKFMQVLGPRDRTLKLFEVVDSF